MSESYPRPPATECRENGRPRPQSRHADDAGHIGPGESPPASSLRKRLIAVWVMLAVSALVTGFLLWQFYRQSANVQISQAESAAVRACRDIGDRYAFYVSGWSGRGVVIDERLKSDLQDVVKAALGRAEGVEGGIWSSASGSLTYAFPTYEGTGPKTDVPPAELPTIQRINNDALRSERPVTVRQSGQSQVLVAHACVLNGPVPDATAWTTTRVFVGKGVAYNQLLTGLAVLTFTLTPQVRLSLYAPKGELRGAILEDGSIVRIAPKEADRFAELLQPGASLAVRGEGIETPYGRVVESREIGSDLDSLVPAKGQKSK
jgi:hypothetical protein